MVIHKVKQGECLASVAEQYGFFWQTIWNNAGNQTLRENRKDPNVLYAEDQIFIPDKSPKEVRKTSGKSYRFCRKGIPAKLRLRILRDAEPRSGEPYVLSIDQQEVDRGIIPADGVIEISIPANAREGILSIGADDAMEQYRLNLGWLNPIDTISGIKARLNNLGFDCGSIDETLDETTISAIQEFQEFINHPDPTGTLDALTKQSLAALHDAA